MKRRVDGFHYFIPALNYFIWSKKGTNIQITRKIGRAATDHCIFEWKRLQTIFISHEWWLSQQHLKFLLAFNTTVYCHSTYSTLSSALKPCSNHELNLFSMWPERKLYDLPRLQVKTKAQLRTYYRTEHGIICTYCNQRHNTPHAHGIFWKLSVLWLPLNFKWTNQEPSR